MCHFLFVFLPLLAFQKLLSHDGFSPVFSILIKVILVLFYTDVNSSYILISSLPEDQLLSQQIA